MGELYFTNMLYVAERVEIGAGKVSDVLYYKVGENYIDIQNLVYEKLITDVNDTSCGDRYAVMNPVSFKTSIGNKFVKEILTLDEALFFFQVYKATKKIDNQEVKTLKK